MIFGEALATAAAERCAHFLAALPPVYTSRPCYAGCRSYLHIYKYWAVQWDGAAPRTTRSAGAGLGCLTEGTKRHQPPPSSGARGPTLRPVSAQAGLERHVLISASRRKKVPGLEVGEMDESAVVFAARRFKPASFLTLRGILVRRPPRPPCFSPTSEWAFWWVEWRWCHWVVQRSPSDQRDRTDVWISV